MSIKDLVDRLSIMVVAYAIVGTFLALCVIGFLADPDSERTKELMGVLTTVAVPAAIAAVLVKRGGRDET